MAITTEVNALTDAMATLEATLNSPTGNKKRLAADMKTLSNTMLKLEARLGRRPRTTQKETFDAEVKALGDAMDKLEANLSRASPSRPLTENDVTIRAVDESVPSPSQAAKADIRALTVELQTVTGRLESTLGPLTSNSRSPLTYKNYKGNNLNLLALAQAMATLEATLGRSSSVSASS